MAIKIEDFSAHRALEDVSLGLNKALASTDGLTNRLQIIDQTVKGRIIFSTSLGLEDQVLFHAIAKAKSRIEVITLDTGRHFPETYDTLARTERVFGKRIRVVMPDADDVEELVSRDGIFGFRNDVEKRKACCNVRKVLPLQRALSGSAGWVTGVRRDQSSTREATPFAAADHQLKLIKISPVADWSTDRVKDYAVEHNVPLNRLHAQGYPSIGCQPCTRPVKPGESIRAGRWWWENEDHKECGLHNAPYLPSGGPR